MPHKKSIILIRANAVSDFRIDLAARHLERHGFEVETFTEIPYYKAGQTDAFICCRPGIQMIDFLNTALSAKRPVVVDLDDDFNAIPKHNPAFRYTGGGHPTYLRELDKLIKQPGVITTYASPELQNRYHHDGIIIPNYWDEENDAWELARDKRDPQFIKFGFSGTTTHRMDFEIIKIALLRILKEFPDTKMVVNLDGNIYNHFTDIPENRKLFLPGISYKDYPLIFRYIDILLVPLKDTHFNRAKSDVKLIEAGASKTAWIASNLPMYQEWGAGGILVDDNKGTPEQLTEKWYEVIKSAIEPNNIMPAVITDGYAKAMTRTSELVCQKWLELMDTIFEGR